jgi:oligosaccharide repeat unit polymerase
MKIASALIRLGVALCSVGVVFFAPNSQLASIYVLVIFSGCLLAYRLDFINLWVAFSMPWLMILACSVLEISDYSRPISRNTLVAVVAVLAIGLVFLPTAAMPPSKYSSKDVHVNDLTFKAVLSGFIAFTILNVVLAGYIPLFRAFLSGDSGYMDFGIKGLYGLYNAFANSFGLIAFYLWVVSGGRALYRNSYLIVLFVFFIFVTRQNIISLLVESFVLYCLTVRRVSGFRVLALALIALFGFSILGDFRVGADIAEIAAIRDEYLWLPRAFIWLFAYCYFNLLNLDNVVESSMIPAFDGGSMASLLPSFLRPDGPDDAEALREVSSLTVDSFISPFYRDVGIWGLLLVFSLICLSARFYISRRRLGSRFVLDSGYAVLYFCFLFSFFVNFWFYLPVIFQLVFLPSIWWLLNPSSVREVGEQSAGS